MNKKIIITSIIIVAIAYTSCNNKNYVRLETTISIDSRMEAYELSNLESEIRQRANYLGIKLIAIEYPKDKSRLIIKTKTKNKNQSLNKIFLDSNTLGFWSTFKITDEPISNIEKNQIKTDNFTSFLDLAKGAFPDEVIGVSKNESDLDRILLHLNDSLKHIENLSLIWSLDAESGYDNNYLLYMINTEGKAKPSIIEKNIKDTNVEKDKYSGAYSILIKFDEQGTKFWSEMTQRAADNGRRSIAIELNNRISTCPRVMEAILGGKCLLTGSFTEKEASHIAKSFSLNSFSSKIEVVSQRVLNGK